jgi:hypothetical protein
MTPLPIFAAIAAMQADCPLICVKYRKNSGLNSDYANLADVWELLRPLLAKHGLGVSFSHGKMRAEGAQFVLEQTLTVYHVASGTLREVTGEFPLPEGNKGVNFAQRFGSAKTYAERYALTAFFGIITGDDDDAARAGEPRQSAAPGTSAGPRWQNFLEDAWCQAPSPDGKNKLCGELSKAEKRQLLLAYPEHPALCAWMAEGLLALIQERGWNWAEVLKAADLGSNGEPTLYDMTPNELHALAEYVRREATL